jgi:hypothetical protein
MAKLSTYKGDTFSTQFTITDQDNAAVDLTGATIDFVMMGANGTPVIEAEVTSHTTPASGITTVTVSKVDMAAVVVGVYDYSLNVTLASGAEYVAEKGVVEVAERYDPA